jgi:hypothetical protein
MYTISLKLLALGGGRGSPGQLQGISHSFMPHQGINPNKQRVNHFLTLIYNLAMVSPPHIPLRAFCL